MFKKLSALVLIAVLATPFGFPYFSTWAVQRAVAQNTMCQTRPVGDSSNACATTAFVTSAIATAIITATSYTAPYTGALTQTIQNWLGKRIQATDFTGVDPTGATFSDAGMANFFAACVKGADCYIPPGIYTFANNVSVDFTGHAANGVYIHGAGATASLFQLAPGKTFTVGCSTGTFPTPTCNVFYASFANFGVSGSNSSDGVFLIGHNDFSDQINGFAFRDMYVANAANTNASSGTIANSIFDTTLDNFTSTAGCSNGNCPTGGAALKLRNAQFSRISGSFSAARESVYFTGSNSYGNTVLTADMEVVNYCVFIDNTNVTYNKVIGGTCVATSFGVIATAGNNNKIDTLYFANPGTAYVAGNFVGISISTSGPVQTTAGDVATYLGADGSQLADSSIPATDLDRLSVPQTIPTVKTFSVSPLFSFLATQGKVCNTAGGGLTTVAGSAQCPGVTQPVDHISFQPGQLAAVVTTKTAFHKFSIASIVDNITAAASSFTCTTNPTITVYECGTSTTCATPTTIGTATVTAAGTAVAGTVSAPGITAGDYVAFAVSAGACTSLDISATVQTHGN